MQNNQRIDYEIEIIADYTSIQPTSDYCVSIKARGVLLTDELKELVLNHITHKEIIKHAIGNTTFDKLADLVEKKKYQIQSKKCPNKPKKREKETDA